MPKLMHTLRSLRFRVMALTLLSPAICQIQAAAQELPRWKLTPAAGIANDRSGNNVTNAIGISIGVRAGRLVVAEAELLRIHNLLSHAQAPMLRAYWVGGNVLVPIRDSGWRPFAIAGIGVGHLMLRQPHWPDQMNTDVAFNIGGGIIIPVSPRMSVRTDVRWLALFDGYDDFYHVARITTGIGFGF
jgi:hypothetical protein